MILKSIKIKTTLVLASGNPFFEIAIPEEDCFVPIIGTANMNSNK
jgi:hypothetical protein